MNTFTHTMCGARRSDDFFHRWNDNCIKQLCTPDQHYQCAFGDRAIRTHNLFLVAFVRRRFADLREIVVFSRTSGKFYEKKNNQSVIDVKYNNNRILSRIERQLTHNLFIPSFFSCSHIYLARKKNYIRSNVSTEMNRKKVIVLWNRKIVIAHQQRHNCSTSRKANTKKQIQNKKQQTREIYKKKF